MARCSSDDNANMNSLCAKAWTDNQSMPRLLEAKGTRGKPEPPHPLEHEGPEGPSCIGNLPRHHFNAPAGISTTYASTSVSLPLPQLELKTTRVKSRLTLACGSVQ
jgi:hypothetical protein